MGVLDEWSERMSNFTRPLRLSASFELLQPRLVVVKALTVSDTGGVIVIKTFL